MTTNELLTAKKDAEELAQMMASVSTEKKEKLKEAIQWMITGINLAEGKSA